MRKQVYLSRVLVIFLCIVCLLSGCGKEDLDSVADNSTRKAHIEQEDLEKAIEIDLTVNAYAEQLLQQELTLCGDTYIAETDSCCNVFECQRNRDNWFYCESYSPFGLDYTYCNKIYQYQVATGETSLLYETWDAGWLNELEASEEYLYWVEYINQEDKRMYQVMQCKIATKEVTCIASRDGSIVGELCLAVSDKYLTWYDDYLDGTVDIVVYDIAQQTFLTVPSAGAFKYMPYEVMGITDDGITFFSKDAEGIVSVNRYQLESGEIYSVQLKFLKSYDKLAGCFSNDQYIGWFTEYSFGTYYFYSMETGEIYRLNAEGNLILFHVLLTDYLYINERIANRIYCYDFETKKVKYQDMKEQYALQLHSYDNQSIYTKAYNFNNSDATLFKSEWTK